ncbi:MAG TPA: lipase family protein, partial [Phototrophicaceae bacterium]|nr:lipase family protein [Phototrophicaceae bacterium]
GPDSATASLDAVRASRELAEAQLGDRTVVWGHSQGGGAALWTGAMSAEYAPELDVAGVAALAPASDLRGLVGNLAGVTGGSVLASFVAAAYAAAYDDVTYREYVRPGAEVVVRRMAERCLATPGVLASVLTALAMSREPTILAADPATGAFGRRLAQNEPPPTVTAPLLLAQGGADTLITPTVQDGYVARLCAAGVDVDYRTYPGRDHLSLVAADSPLTPELLAWTADRFSGTPVAGGCTDT